nr:hypothetical protein [Morchella crassipes]
MIGWGGGEASPPPPPIPPPFHPPPLPNNLNGGMQGGGRGEGGGMQEGALRAPSRWKREGSPGGASDFLCPVTKSGWVLRRARSARRCPANLTPGRNWTCFRFRFNVN